MPFWDPVFREDGDRLVLSPKRFYLLMSNEAVSIPPNLAAEMTAYDPTSGELRTHYAGFFDPGFGFDPTGWLQRFTRRARGARSRRALHGRERPSGLQVDLRAHARGADLPLRLRHRVVLPATRRDAEPLLPPLTGVASATLSVVGDGLLCPGSERAARRRPTTTTTTTSTPTTTTTTPTSTTTTIPVSSASGGAAPCRRWEGPAVPGAAERGRVRARPGATGNTGNSGDAGNDGELRATPGDTGSSGDTGTTGNSGHGGFGHGFGGGALHAPLGAVRQALPLNAAVAAPLHAGGPSTRKGSAPIGNVGPAGLQGLPRHDGLRQRQRPALGARRGRRRADRAGRRRGRGHLLRHRRRLLGRGQRGGHRPPGGQVPQPRRGGGRHQGVHAGDAGRERRRTCPASTSCRASTPR
jgi:hypothetical protein